MMIAGQHRVVLNSAQWACVYRNSHRNKGLCTQCSRPLESGSLCAEHRVKANAKVRETYAWKKEHGYCVKGGCWEQAQRGCYCELHRIMRAAEAKAARRAN